MGPVLMKEEMGERPADDTTETSERSRRKEVPGAYYYDDRTGYETYDPEREEDEEEACGGGEAADGG